MPLSVESPRPSWWPVSRKQVDVRMEAEIVIVVLVAFVSGGTMGAAGMLLSQWVVRKMSPPPQRRLDNVDARDIEAMKADVADMAVRLHSVDARLDFTEQLLGGALSGARPPAPLAPPQSLPPQSLPAEALPPESPQVESPPTRSESGHDAAASSEAKGEPPDGPRASSEESDGLKAAGAS